MRDYIFDVLQIQPLTDRVVRIYIQCQQEFIYQAGQYLEVVLGQQAMPYSIANAPLGAKQIELHIGHSQDNPWSTQLLDHIKQQGSIQVRGPQGQCTHHLMQNRPTLFVAGGTGFAPIKAIIEQALMSELTQPMHLFWGARQIHDLYCSEMVEHWDKHVEHFKYTPVLSNPVSSWQGEVGSLRNAVINHYKDLTAYQTFIAGPFDMVFAARDTFLDCGHAKERIFSDAFDLTDSN